MFNVNGWEIVIVAVIAIIVFGPERLPELAIQLGQIVRELRKATDAATFEITRELEAAAHEARLAEAELLRVGESARAPLTPPPDTEISDTATSGASTSDAETSDADAPVSPQVDTEDPGA